MRPGAWTGAPRHGSAFWLGERLEVQLTPLAGW
jgi:hypothetical protein